MGYALSEAQIELIAIMAHEANRQYCASIGDHSQPDWEEAPDWQQESALNGVMFHLNNPEADAAASHNNWLQAKLQEGWTWGPEKNPELKKHPCMLPFEELPFEQRTKDYIFRSVVHAAAFVLSNY